MISERMSVWHVCDGGARGKPNIKIAGAPWLHPIHSAFYLLRPVEFFVDAGERCTVPRAAQEIQAAHIRNASLTAGRERRSTAVRGGEGSFLFGDEAVSEL